MVDAAPRHVETVRRHVFDPLSPAQVSQLRSSCETLLAVLDPQGRMTNRAE